MFDLEPTRAVPRLVAALLFAHCVLHAQVQHVPPVYQALPQPYPPPTTVTVKQDGSGNYTTITDAVSHVLTGTKIEVYPGIYQEYGIDFGDKNLVLESFVKWEAVIQAQPPDQPCVQLQAIFRLTQNQTNASVISGFKLIRGRSGRGGAIYCYGSSPTITNNWFEDNSSAYGGAIYAQFGAPRITDNKFIANGYGGASGSCGPDAFDGGAILLVTSSAFLEDNLFSGNRAHSGGGLSVTLNSHVTLGSNNQFDNNSATSAGGGLAVTSGSAVTVAHCAFNGNQAVASGGGAWLSGASVYVTQFDQVQFQGNSAYDGGGLHCEGASGVFTNCPFGANTSEHSGGGIYCSGAGSPLFDNNCDVHHNVAGSAGGGVAFAFDNTGTIRRSQIHDNDVQAGAGVGKGGGIYVEAASVTIKQNSITGNGRTSSLGSSNKCWRGGGIAYVGSTSQPYYQGHIDANVITLNEVKANQSYSGEGAGVYMKGMGPSSTFGSNVVASNYANEFIHPTDLHFNRASLGAGVMLDVNLDDNTQSAFRFYNNTIVSNVNGINLRGLGGGIYFRTVSQTFDLYNNIVLGNLATGDPTIEVDTSAFPRAKHCCVANQPLTFHWTLDSATLVNADPHFIGGGNYHIQDFTLMRDAGDNYPVNTTIRPFDIDMDGAPRISGGTVDIGADEL